ncbi:hypothetical protein SCD_n01071 [Sulfuricella denitrificans skB26]|uniref:Uncharacterized protein n=1 Tax=Sulfuricella denitrificans (strain DSM 22764 / NBRC 105220 / skB26) TaxID=1163617 RepID=S6B2K6_SULDS|nr:hypothetical protein [Sulfuricella denitrificans]BAN34907.1 hypothetical protein SCD_n01071 [Sulfuricella denitrificans skB26]
MSEIDNAKEAAEQVGGWENLARGLYEQISTGSNALLNEAYRLAVSERSRQLFSPRKGTSKFYTLGWGWRLEEMLAEAIEKNLYEIEKTIIGKVENLRCFYGKSLGTTSKKRIQANKTIRNYLGKWRKVNRLHLATLAKEPPYVDPMQHIVIDDD